MKLGQKFLKLLNPKGEEHRQDFRQCVAMMRAQAEDVDRTIRMNGFTFLKHPEESPQKK